MKLLPFGFYRVAGDSMQPTYRPGQVLLGLRWRRPRLGDVVVAHNGLPLIKRVGRIDSDGYWLIGDNAAASIDSRSFGAIRRDQVEAVIIAKIASSS